MCNVRIEALRSLADAISGVTPGLSPCVGQVPPGKMQAFPTVAIVPSTWKYMPEQAEERYDPAPDRVVMNVGKHEAIVQIRIGSTSPGARYDLEQKILDVFLSGELHPGVLMTTITNCEELGPFQASWELEDDHWQDEHAFDGQFWTLIQITGSLPALVTRTGAHTIEQLQLGLAQSDVAVNASNFNSEPDVTVGQVNEDGSFTPL
jgi:hypothetical protein